jgi:hypothetical protein
MDIVIARSPQDDDICACATLGAVQVSNPRSLLVRHRTARSGCKCCFAEKRAQ